MTNIIMHGSVDYVKDLEHFYDSDKQDRERHGQRLKQRDDAKLKAMSESSDIKKLAAIRDFVASAKGATGAMKSYQQQTKAVEFEKGREERMEVWEKMGPAEYREKMLKAYDDSVEEMGSQQVAFFGYLKKMRDASILAVKNGGEDFFPEKNYNFLVDSDPSRQARIRETFQLAKLQNIKGAWEEAKLTKPWNERLDAAEGNIRLQQGIREDWVHGYIGQSDASDPFYAKYITPEKKKFIEVGGVIDNIAANQVRLNNNETTYAQIQDKLLNAGPEGSLSLGAHESSTIQNIIVTKGYTDIPGGLTATQQATEDWVVLQERLIQAKENSSDDLPLLLNSIVPSKDPDAQQKTFKEQYLSGKKDNHGKRMVNRLYTAENERKLVDVETAKIQGQVSIKNAIADIHSGRLDEDEIIKLKNTVLPAAKSLGLSQTDNYKTLDDINPNNYSQKSYNKYKDANQAYFTGELAGQAFLHKANFKNIPHGGVVRELNQLAEDQVAYLNKLGLPTTEEGWRLRSKSTYLKSAGQNAAKIFGPEDVLTGSHQKVAVEMRNAELKALDIGRRQFIKPDSSASDYADAEAKASTLFTTEQQRNGYDVIDEPKPKGKVGRWSSDNLGNLNTFNYQYAIKGERADTGDKYDQKKWDKEVIDGKTSDRKRELPNAELAGLFLKDGEDVEKVVDIQFSKETRWKAWRNKKSASAFSLEELQKLKVSKADEDVKFVDQMGGKPVLNRMEKLLKASPEIKLADIVKSINDKDITGIFERGLHNASTPELTRFWLAMEKYEGRT